MHARCRTREGCIYSNHQLTSGRPTTSSIARRLGCNISRKGDGGGESGGGTTRPPLTYPRPDKPFLEPIPPRPCTPSAPLYARSEQSQRLGVALKNGAGNSYFRSPSSSSSHPTIRPFFRYSIPLMSLKFRSIYRRPDIIDASRNDKLITKFLSSW